MLLKAVEAAFERLAPRSLAGAWDNTGSLLKLTPKAHQNTVVLTIDLTPAVLDNLPPNTGLVVAYHPPIFRGLKSLSENVPLQASLMRCIQNNIAIYTPHSALDGAQGGINDFLATGFGAGSAARLKPTPAEGHPYAGEGVLLTLDQPISNVDFVNRVKSLLGLQTVMFAAGGKSIQTIAICAGSGASMLSGVQADAYFTGEMQHHDTLAAVAQGTSVCLTCHSNTERPYLTRLAPKLLNAMNEFKASQEGGHQYGPWEVVISDADREPLQFV